MPPFRAFVSRSALVTVAAAFFLSACGGSSSGPGGTDHGLLVDPCALLTRPEAEALLTRPILTTRQDTSDYILTCTYAADSNVRVAVKAFTSAGVKASQGEGSTFTPQAYLASLRLALDAAGWEDVAGVGTEAIWAVKPGKLTFYQGDLVAEILFSPAGKAIDTSSAARAGAVSAGTAIAAKL